MWPRFGIKIGNSTLCIAHVRENGKVEVIANNQGDRNSQACLLWDGVEEIECGLTAKQKMALRPKQAVANCLQLLQESAVSAEQLKHIPCLYNEDIGKFQLQCQTNDDDGDAKELELSVHNVLVHLFKAELELARQYYTEEAHKPTVVLSIPSYYPDTAWPTLKNAAEEAGFHVAQIISESTASILAYNLGEPPLDDNKTVLTIKSGGLYSHFALYEVRKGLLALKENYGPFPIGGHNYTEVLVDFICTEFQRKYKLDPMESRRSIAKIRTVAANCKHILTALPSTKIYIDSLMDGLDFNVNMTRARYESLIQPVITQFMHTLQQCVAAETHIDFIVLLGATMQIPKLQAAIGARYKQAQLLCSLPSDEVVAVGCANQATYLADADGEELSVSDEISIAAAQVMIWHGENESAAQVLLDKGAIIPYRVQLNVPSCTQAHNSQLFQLRTSDGSLSQICLSNAKPDATKMYRIEAEVACQIPDEQPTIRLRCVGGT